MFRCRSWKSPIGLLFPKQIKGVLQEGERAGLPLHVFDDLLNEPLLENDAVPGGGLLNRKPQFVDVHVGDENYVFFDQLRELRERAEAIEKIGTHRQDKLGRTGRFLRDLNQRGDEILAERLFGSA